MTINVPALAGACLMALALAACSSEPEARAMTEKQADEAPVAQAPAVTGVAPPPVIGQMPPAQAAAQQQPSLAVEGEGLRWFLPPNGSARPIPFGTPMAEVLASLERVRGEAGQGTNQDCGAGPVRYASWADGLSLVFQDGRFAGWGLDRRAAGAISTADNIGPGTNRAELDDAFGPPLEIRQTSLGTEFTAGAISGLFDGTSPSAEITDMWAGVSCVAR